MSIVTTRFNNKFASDGISYTGDADFTLTNALLGAIYDPPVDVTDVEVINTNTDHGLRITIYGKDSSGADTIVGVLNTKPADNTRQEYAEYIKKNSLDQGQRVNKIQIEALNAATGALAVAGDILSDVFVEINVLNK